MALGRRSHVRNIKRMSHPETSAETLSSRRRTRESGMFIRDTPGVRALDRGLQLLRAFRPGINSLTNAELAERSGLPRASVSRLTATLVAAGFLDFEVTTGLYRPGTPFLALGQAVRTGSVVLQAALPIMREVSEGHRINVGLAVADDIDIVYLDSVRKSQSSLFRHIMSGTRLPVAETALGRAWLAGLPPKSRKAMMEALAQRYGPRWPHLRKEVMVALADVQSAGYCAHEHRSSVMAVAAPLVMPGHALHVLNISYRAPTEPSSEQTAQYGALLLEMTQRLQRALVAR
jgi:DNA-binding IclR family transcriptional regulator